MFYNRLKGLLLTAVIGVTACTDVWEEHYETPAESLPVENLYEYISTQEDLSTFAEMIALVGYDTLLAQSQSYTVWAPVNEAFVGFDKTDKELVEKTVSNHIARGKQTTAMLEASRIDLLSMKNVDMSYTGDQYFFDVARMTDYNNLTSNGLVHKTDQYVPFKPNFYELLADYEGLDSLKEYVYSYQLKEFDPENSVELGLDDLNRPIYDSAFNYSNEVLDYMGDFDDESESFLGVMLDNNAWEDGYAQVSKYLNIADFQGGAERKRRLTQLVMTKDLMFDLKRYGIEDYMSQDSLVSTGYTVFYEPSAWLSALPKVDVSNGSAYIADQFPYEDTTFLLQPIVVEAERSFNRENSNNAIMTRASYASDYDISQNYYISATPTSLSASAKSTIKFTIPNTLSTKYNIYCVFVPHSIVDENNKKSSRVTFRFTYIYKSSGRTRSMNITPDVNETNVDGLTKMFVTQHDFEFANVATANPEDEVLGYNDAVVSLQVENLVQVTEESDSSLYTRNMLIDCIILEPVVE